jgi:hypothetical protein
VGGWPFFDFPYFPNLDCLKKTGPLLSILIKIAVTRKIGINVKINTIEVTKSKNLFKMKYILDINYTTNATKINEK